MSKKKKKKNLNQETGQQNSAEQKENSVQKDSLNEEVKKENTNIEVRKEVTNSTEKAEETPKIALKSEEVSQKSIEELREEAIQKENELRHPKKKKNKNKEQKVEASQEKKADLNNKEKEDNKEEKTQEVKTVKEEKALTKKPENKDLDYIDSKAKKDKKIGKILIVIILILLIALGLSTGFAIVNLGNTKILNGISIKEIDVSNLSQIEARNLLKEKLENQLNVKYKLKYQDYEKEITPQEIEFAFKIDEASMAAFNYGREGNILENNFLIVKTLIKGEQIPLNYSYNKEELDKIIEEVGKNIPGVVQNPSYYIEGDGLYIDKGKDGISLLKDRLEQSILTNMFEWHKPEATEIKIDIPVENKKAEKIDIEKISSEIKCEPKDAYYDTEPEFKIYKEVNGVALGASIEDAQKLVSNDANGTVGDDGVLLFRVPLIITPATKTINDIGLEAFPYEIATFTTRFDATNYSRSNNLQIATDKIDGTVLMPGEEFSFNEVVGKRTIEEGYQDAKIYENGRVVDGLAGGICQVSSTLYNAALLSNLEVTERSNHSFTTSYLPAGRDATVVYGVKDLKFVNTRNYPIKIDGGLESGILRFTIYGIKEEEELDIRIFATVVDTIPGRTETKVDYSLAPGQVVIEQSGHAGCRSVTTMKKYLDGELVYDEVISSDTYNQMTTIKRVGPGEE